MWWLDPVEVCFALSTGGLFGATLVLRPRVTTKSNNSIDWWNERKHPYLDKTADRVLHE